MNAKQTKCTKLKKTQCNAPCEWIVSKGCKNSTKTKSPKITLNMNKLMNLWHEINPNNFISGDAKKLILSTNFKTDDDLEDVLELSALYTNYDRKKKITSLEDIEKALAIMKKGKDAFQKEMKRFRNSPEIKQISSPKQKPILEWSYDYDDDIDEDAINDSYNSFYKKNKKVINKGKYVYVSTGYTHRILENKTLFENLKEIKDVVAILPDLYWKPEMKSWSRDKDGLALCLELPKSLIKKGGVLFKTKIDGKELSFVDILCELDYCSFCSIKESQSKWYKIKDEIIQVIEVDAESG